MEAYVFPLVALFVFLIFTEILTVDILYDKSPELDFNLNILGIRLRPEDTVKRKKQRKRRKKRARKDAFAALMPVILYVLSHSHTEIKGLHLTIDSNDAADFFIKRGVLTSFINSVLTLIEENSKTFSKENIIICASDNTNIKFYVKLTVPLMFIARAVFVYLKQRFLAKRRKTTNVGS